MDDSEYEQDAVFVDHVVHDAVVADTQPVERVGLAADRFHLLAPDPATGPCGCRAALERIPNFSRMQIASVVQALAARGLTLGE